VTHHVILVARLGGRNHILGDGCCNRGYRIGRIARRLQQRQSKADRSVASASSARFEECHEQAIGITAYSDRLTAIIANQFAAANEGF